MLNQETSDAITEFTSGAGRLGLFTVRSQTSHSGVRSSDSWSR